MKTNVKFKLASLIIAFFALIASWIVACSTYRQAEIYAKEHDSETHKKNKVEDAKGKGCDFSITLEKAFQRDYDELNWGAKFIIDNNLIK
ncbi:MAG: hypothetical protein LBC19_03230 [Tannerella sp.]|jgi:hypothetical protein|nr:hypothetical protein [Tannerella sp.]